MYPYSTQSPAHPASPPQPGLSSPPPPPPPPKTAAPHTTSSPSYSSPHPSQGSYPPPLPPTPQQAWQEKEFAGTSSSTASGHAAQGGAQRQEARGPAPPDPGWVPEVVADMSKADLEHLLRTPELLTALVNHPSHAHPSLTASNAALAAALERTAQLAAQADAQATQLEARRAQVSQHLLSARALDQSWRRKEGEMETALAPFAPRALYARLQLSIGEQEEVCTAVEEGWIEGGEGLASERETVEWLRRVREGRKLLELRRERRARWDEGRVGGWR